MHSTECAIVKIISPNWRKRQWLEQTEAMFAQAVQLGLDAAKEQRTANRTKLHQAAYHQARDIGLPADYSRMAINAAVSLARSFYGLRRKKQRASFPRVRKNPGIGLGVNSYKLMQRESRWVLRVSTGKRGDYIWLPLCASPKVSERLASVYGDARLYRRGGNWSVALPVRVQSMPAGCSGEHTFIGVDLGIVRHATVAAPDRVIFFPGKAARQRREHFASLRKRLQRHRRTDRVKAAKGKESRWMRDINHKISREIVDIAAHYPSPVIVLERLDGIRNRTKGSKRFKRMVASWAFRQLVDFIRYKAARSGIPVVFVDPRGTSKTCPRCGHATRSNRPSQGHFRCVSCGYRGNADMVAARNIAAAGPAALSQGRPDTARPNGQAGDTGPRLDGVQVCDSTLSHTDPNLASPESGTPRL